MAQIPKVEQNMTDQQKVNEMIPNGILIEFCYTHRIGAEPNCHQRGIIEQPMGAAAENHNQTLSGTLGTPRKRGKKD